MIRGISYKSMGYLAGIKVAVVVVSEGELNITECDFRLTRVPALL
jgi:hypothetical protein